jgi:hypothetical protein
MVAASTGSTPIWILTFNRPHALNRLIMELGRQGFTNINVFSNHPKVQYTKESSELVKQTIVNSLNCEESNSWCARSWNTIFMKCFNDKMYGGDEIICFQDDTFIAPTFGKWFENSQAEFLWGPAGDQFFYIQKHIFQKVGWWDERYIGCYCGDAEYVKRVYMAAKEGDWLQQISVEDSHNWGFRHNASGISENIITTYGSKTIDPDYDNQHWQLERISGCGGTTTETNPTILASQQLFRDKWGVDLDNGKPIIDNLDRKMPEIDWYPWFTQKHGVNANDHS